MGFDSYCLNQQLRKGLASSGYTEPTLVQKKVLPVALSGANVICSAKTGSGKTLSYLIPVLQRLLDVGWCRTDGLGALVLAPTRELALQIFSVLQKVGRYTNLSGGLLIGGRDAEQEKDKLAALNVVVGTPGRLLEHFESAWDFNGDNLEVLVVDEVDKMMEMGFKETVERILEYVTEKRRTLLFSATAEPLARANGVWGAKNPEYISVCDGSLGEAVPSSLVQKAYWVRPSEKFALLYRVIKQNMGKRVIVFLSTCKEVTFFYTLFKYLRLGMRLLYLNGNMCQNKRVETYHKFAKDETNLLFCTDLAARGLDFPNVNLVLQLDVPDTKETYIHRAGRTARNGQKGEACIALLSREKAVAEELAEVPGFPEVVPFRKPGSNDLHGGIEDRVRAVIRKTPEIYILAQKYVKTYKGHLRVTCKGQKEVVEQGLAELVEFLGVSEDENVAWSLPAKKKRRTAGTRTVLDGDA